MAQYTPPESLHVGTGVETVFGFTFPYLVASDLKVTVNGGIRATVLASPYQVQINPAPALNSEVRIYRDTPAQQPAYLFDSGIPFLPKYVDTNNKQLLHAVQEGLLSFQQVDETARLALAQSTIAIRDSALALARSLRTLRVSDDEPPIPALANKASRANKVLGFDAEGNPKGTLPASGSGTELALDLSNGLADDLGDALIAVRHPAAPASRSQHSKNMDYVSALDFCAAGHPGIVTASALNAACLTQYLRGGGLVHIPGGVHTIEDTVIQRTGVIFVGAGKGATRLKARPGLNASILRSERFFELTGVGAISDAPYGFGAVGMDLDGTYFDLGPTGQEIEWRVCETVLNTQGCGVQVFGSQMTYDVGIYNCADQLMYLEGQGTYYPNHEHGSRINVQGRISGYENIVFRGPGDISLDYIITGLAGLIPLSQRATTTSRKSRLYPDDEVDGIVADNANGYQGHGEWGLIHPYATSFGYGFRTRGVNRLNARHLATDNCRGGFHFADGTHGLVSIAESRANGRKPAGYFGTGVPPLYDMLLDNGTIWNLNIKIKVARYLPSQGSEEPQILLRGSNNIVEASVQGQMQTDGRSLRGGAMRIEGDNNVVTLEAKRINGDVLSVSGAGNSVRGSANTVWGGTVFHRDGTQAYGNIVHMTAQSINGDCWGFRSTGTPSQENLILTFSGSAGFQPFTGDPMAAANRACTWQVAGSIGNSINAKTTEDYVEANLPTTQLSGTLSIPHNFLYTPYRNQINPSLNFPGTMPNQLVMLGVKDATATHVNIEYLWAALPTSGGANVQCHIR